MPAAPLSAEQLADAARLKSAFKKAQQSRRESGRPWSQEAIAAEAEVGNQSALNQYLNGKIPLNLKALISICRAIDANPAEISPDLINRKRAESADLLGYPEDPNVIEVEARELHQAPKTIKLDAGASLSVESLLRRLGASIGALDKESRHEVADTLSAWARSGGKDIYVMPLVHLLAPSHSSAKTAHR